MDYIDPQIETERLYLRKLERADAETIFEIFSDPEVTRYWSFPAMKDKNDAISFIDETHKGFDNNSLLEWGIVNRKSGTLIGTCAYASWDPAHRRAEIGFALHRDEWGKGFMKELLRSFLPFAFDKLDLHRIEADVDPRNLPSIHLLEHFGFRREGYLRERYLLNGEEQDALLYALLRKDFTN
ncbi:MAG: GNAT family protein [Balneolaceae bacterium]|nr:GNAT family protein [Balneolaceae bacterium]